VGLHPLGVRGEPKAPLLHVHWLHKLLGRMAQVHCLLLLLLLLLLCPQCVGLLDYLVLAFAIQWPAKCLVVHCQRAAILIHRAELNGGALPLAKTDKEGGIDLPWRGLITGKSPVL